MKETCSCGHDKASHYAETIASGDTTQQSRRVVYRMCLAVWCECREFKTPPPDEAA